MERQKLDPNQVNQLLDAASKKLGVPPQQLKAELETGKYDAMLKNMSPAQTAMMKNVLENPKKLEKLINSPQAKALLQKMSGKK